VFPPAPKACPACRPPACDRRVHPLTSERPLQSTFSLPPALGSSPGLGRARSRERLTGFRSPSSRHQQGASTCRAEDPPPRYVPSSAFLPPSTACSVPCLAGLFHPATTSRVRPPGIWPRRGAVPGYPRPLPSCRFLERACGVTRASSLDPGSRALLPTTSAASIGEPVRSSEAPRPSWASSSSGPTWPRAVATLSRRFHPRSSPRRALRGATLGVLPARAPGHVYPRSRTRSRFLA
jgi:hypothetical protein